MNRESISSRRNIHLPLQVLQSVLDRQILFIKEYDSESELLYDTCEIIAKYNKIKLTKPQIKNANISVDDYMRQLASSSNIRIRKIGLKDRWWQSDNGAMLCFYHDSPCALIPKRRGFYSLIDLRHRRRLQVTEEIATKISTEGYFLYRSFPTVIKSFKDILKFAFHHTKRDLYLFFSIEALIVLVSLLIPFFTGILFSNVVPSANHFQLWQIIAALFISTALTTLFTIAQSASLIRLRFKTEANLQPAIWDRILRFPSHFIKQFSAGDLTFRASVITDIQEILSQSSLATIAYGFSTILFLIFMLFYSVILTVVVVAFTVIIISFTFYIIHKELHFSKRMYYFFGKFIGISYQILEGIVKVRVSDASFRVFSIWADRLAQRSKAEVQERIYLQKLETFIGVMTVISPLVLYGLVILLGTHLSFGSFIAFNSAFSMFFAGLLHTANTICNVVIIIPLWNRAKSIITAKIDNESDRVQPGTLSGDISIKNLVFRYRNSEKYIFKNLNIEIKAGEFIALVGPSGTGKSTLFRLLLGFEEPISGSIFYNNINLTTLKLSSVRKQIGTVIQNSALIPGTIRDNIIGSSTTLSRRNAWEIAEKVGIQPLIKALPMQMDTLITEGSVTLSGGEKQRLILARALAQNPKIIFLDEATSALDNKTQVMVHNYLKTLHSTQVIAAHRLSTIQEADRIYVIEKGEIVQVGNFESLMAEPGLFSKLAKRQLK